MIIQTQTNVNIDTDKWLYRHIQIFIQIQQMVKQIQIQWLCRHRQMVIQTQTNDHTDTDTYVGHGGALVESRAFNRRVVGSTPALANM